MSQVFSADSVNAYVNTTLTLTTETTAITGNFLSPPFQNAKASVKGLIYFTTGAGTTSVTIRVRRNPNAESVNLSGLSNLNVSAPATYAMPFQVADPIPDARPVQYTVTVQQNGATGNGNITFASIETMLISG